jgi:hypothetical protein
MPMFRKGRNSIPELKNAAESIFLKLTKKIFHLLTLYMTNLHEIRTLFRFEVIIERMHPR